MGVLIAAAGEGYQRFLLTSGSWAWIAFVLCCGAVAVLFGVALMAVTLRSGQGSQALRNVASAIQEGAVAFLKRQFKTILYIVVPLAVLVFFTATSVKEPSGQQALSFAQSGIFRVVAFLVGATCSGLTGFIGMSLAVRGNVRTAAAAHEGRLPAALRIAFRTGAITGMFCVGLGLAGATALFAIFQNTATAVLVGFGFGASLLALFMRVGGGIYTKAADVGADLVGKVEVGIPEDDPRNAAVIADNVGDNVGDCAGMAADLFESYAITIIASVILGYAAFKVAHPHHVAAGILFPLIVPAIGILASIVGVLAVRATDRTKNGLRPISWARRLAGALTLGGVALVVGFYVKDWRVFVAVLAGVLLNQVASAITEYFTSTERRPVKEIAESARTGPATTILTGVSVGLESTVWAIIAIALAIAVAIALGHNNIILTLYFVALVGSGMLSTTGMVVSEDSFGPVADNAAGIAEMAGELEGEAGRVMVSLDAVGNTTKAVTKGVAIGSAVIAAVALFASFVETVGQRKGLAINSQLFSNHLTQVNLANPTIFIGLLIGGSIAFLFSSLAIRAVGRSASVVVEEVRRQFREHPGIMEGTEKPEYSRVISICTAAAQRELATPALLAVLSPVIVGFGINYLALGAFLAAAILTGQLMAVFLANSGGAWDNAKKYIEDGHEGGKGSEAHKAAVIGDTVGDPFKDTAGPALNPLIKVMNLVSLLILPAVISLQYHTAARLAIAGVALVVLLAAIAFSKRPAGLVPAQQKEEEVTEPALKRGEAPAPVS